MYSNNGLDYLSTALNLLKEAANNYKSFETAIPASEVTFFIKKADRFLARIEAMRYTIENEFSDICRAEAKDLLSDVDRFCQTSNQVANVCLNWICVD